MQEGGQEEEEVYEELEEVISELRESLEAFSSEQQRLKSMLLLLHLLQMSQQPWSWDTILPLWQGLGLTNESETKYIQEVYHLITGCSLPLP